AALVTAEPRWRADADGRITAEELARGDARFVVRAPGYVPQVVEGGETGERLVRLESGGTLDVTVVDEAGRPVEGAQVVVSAEAVGLPDDLTREGIGHPLARRPVWLRHTGPLGSCRFDELPRGPGRYLHVFHDHLVPTTR